MMPTPKSVKQWTPSGEGDCGVNIHTYSDDSTVYGQVTRTSYGWDAFDMTKLNKQETGPLRIGRYDEIGEAKQAVEDYFSEIK